MRISDWSSDVCSSDLPARIRDKHTFVANADAERSAAGIGEQHGMGAVLVEAHHAAVGIARVDLSFEVHCNAFRSDAGAIGKALDIAQLVIVWIRIGGRRGGRLPCDRERKRGG